jgi:CheY-like chemotaxis protein
MTIRSLGIAVCTVVIAAALQTAFGSLLSEDESAIFTVRSTAFDVIISDINMPGYGGLQFLRGLRSTSQLVAGSKMAQESSRCASG